MDGAAAEQLEPAVLFVEGDLLIVRPHGNMVIDIAQRFVEQLHQLHSRYGRYYLLVDLRRAAVLSPGTRRLLAEHEAVCPPAAVAVFGGGAIGRGMNALFQGAIVALGGQRRTDHLFATEPEARDWLAAERQRLQ